MTNASSTTNSLHSNGILRDPCEGGNCGADGMRWNGPVDVTDAGRQQSALDLMNAAS